MGLSSTSGNRLERKCDGRGLLSLQYEWSEIRRLLSCKCKRNQTVGADTG